MNPTKTIATLATLATLTLSTVVNVADAFEGSVTLYEHYYFQGASKTFPVRTAQTCMNFGGCFENVASSARWGGIPGNGGIVDHTWITFFTDPNCKGSTYTWRGDEGSLPTRFEGAINDAFSSFMVVDNWSYGVERIQNACIA